MNLNQRCRAYWRDLSNKHETAMSRGVTEITGMRGSDSERSLHWLTFSFAACMLREVFWALFNDPSCSWGVQRLRHRLGVRHLLLTSLRLCIGFCPAYVCTLYPSQMQWLVGRKFKKMKKKEQANCGWVPLVSVDEGEYISKQGYKCKPFV